jgi:hypothetical protein
MTTDICMAARELMREADRLSGASPAMSHAALHACFAGVTRDKLLARHRMRALSQTRDSEERGELGEAITLQAAENPAVRRLLKQEFPIRFRMTRGRGKTPGRPKVTEAERVAAKRAAARAYRERRKRGGTTGDTAAPGDAATDRRDA